MARVFVTRAIPGRAIEMLGAAGHETDVWPGELPPQPDALAERLRGAAAVLAMVTDRIGGELLAASADLRVIANMAVGYDNVDPSEAANAGVWLTNTPGVLAETTADLAFALLLDAARHVSRSERETRAGGWKTWSPMAYLGPDVHGTTLGIVGLGEIGTAMARRAQGFSMRVLYNSRSPKPAAERELGVVPATFEDLLLSSDFVSIHAPLTEETRGMFDSAAFSRMKQGAILVNTARGPIVDQDALVEALKDGPLGGAALDVTTPEPLPLDHPLFSLSNVTITPHIGSAGALTRARMAEMAAQNIVAVLDGRVPPNAVNRPANPRQPAR